MSTLPPSFQVLDHIARALAAGEPVVALESTVVTHGLPSPDNLTLAVEMENVVAASGAIPATIALLDGRVRIGLNTDEIARLANEEGLRKISVRDFGAGIQSGSSGGTTVAGTIFAATQAGIRVMATGGIGGIHRVPDHDISTDLPQLAKTPMIVVCAGAKAILDLEATLEFLETWGVPVVGFGTDRFPAFYTTDSGLALTMRANSPEAVAEIGRAHWIVGNQSAVLVVVPPPKEAALDADIMWEAVDQALDEAAHAGVRGQEVTPFLLDRVSQLTGGASLKANLALLKNNARIAAQIATALAIQL